MEELKMTCNCAYLEQGFTSNGDIKEDINNSVNFALSEEITLYSNKAFRVI